VTGTNYWLVIGPAVFALALVVWIGLVVRAARRRRRYGGGGEQADRGVVSGGRIQGAPSQVSRRDEAPRRD
jgi:hypothetical protein